MRAISARRRPCPPSPAASRAGRCAPSPPPSTTRRPRRPTRRRPCADRARRAAACGRPSAIFTTRLAVALQQPRLHRARRPRASRRHNLISQASRQPPHHTAPRVERRFARRRIASHKKSAATEIELDVDAPLGLRRTRLGGRRGGGGPIEDAAGSDTSAAAWSKKPRRPSRWRRRSIPWSGDRDSIASHQSRQRKINEWGGEPFDDPAAFLHMRARR